MDYDSTDIPGVYDRGRDHGPEVLQLWMEAVSSAVGSQQISTILDLGCGTGRFSEALASHFNAEVIGVDPSTKMLDQARNKLRDPRVRYEAGCGEAIPLPDDSVDLVFMSMSFHHFEDPKAAARECRRVLPTGATAFLRAGIRDRISSYPYVEFFPASRPILEDCLPTAAFICEVFESAGLSTVSSRIVKGNYRNAESVWPAPTLSGLTAKAFLVTQGCAGAPTAGLELANAFGVLHSQTKLTHYLSVTAARAFSGPL